MKNSNFSKKLIEALALFAVQVFSQSSFTDNRDGKKYKAVKIGEQVWMAENLNYNAENSECYEKQESNCTKYGRLYNWETSLKICPAGWHLPSSDEWVVLAKFVGDSIANAGGGSVVGRVGDSYLTTANKSFNAGIKLKAKSGWNNNGNGTDDFDFSALPCGYGIQTLGSFYHFGEIGYWWSATENNANVARSRSLKYNYANIDARTNHKGDLLSVRCIQD
jgi:uncharacterized protein (TIGR02145 family)